MSGAGVGAGMGGGGPAVWGRAGGRQQGPPGPAGSRVSPEPPAGGSRSSLEEPGLSPGPRRSCRGRAGRAPRGQADSGAGNLTACGAYCLSSWSHSRSLRSLPWAPLCPGGQGGRGEVSSWYSLHRVRKNQCKRNWTEHNGLRDTAVAAGLCSKVYVKQDRRTVCS